MSEDRTGGFALALERAFTEFGVVGGRAGGGDGGEGRECREFELCGDELASRDQELVRALEEFGVFGGPCGESGKRHVGATSDVGECAGFEESGEDRVVVRVCEFHA